MPGSYSAARTIVSGTPARRGTSVFTVKGTDGQGQPLRQTYRIKVDRAPPLAVSFPGSCCSSGTVGAAYSQNFFSSGGVGPFTWSVAAGTLPPGLALSSPSAPRVVGNHLSGTPTTAGTFTFTIKVTGSAGHDAIKSDRIVIHP